MNPSTLMRLKTECSVLFSIYIYIGIYIYIYQYEYIYLLKKEWNVLRSFAKEQNVLAFFCVLCKRTLRSLRFFTFFAKECCVSLCSFPIFIKERKRMELSFGSHKSLKTQKKKNGKERGAQPCCHLDQIVHIGSYYARGSEIA